MWSADRPALSACAHRVKQGARAVGDFQARLLLTLLYYLLALPIGLLLRLRREGLELNPPPHAASFWHVRPLPESELRTARRQG